MPQVDGHQYRMHVFKAAAPCDLLGTFALRPDWETALECAAFSAVRKGVATRLALGGDCGRIEPRWDDRLGEPFIEGFRVIVAPPGRRTAAFDLPVAYFSEVARAISTRLVDEGKLADGECYLYTISAVAKPPAAADAGQRDADDDEFAVRPLAQVLELHEASMDDLLASSSTCGTVAEDQLPVFVPQHVLDEASDAMSRAGNREVGGILIGRLCRDRRRRDLFLEVTAQIPARHAVEESTRLTFTPDTWTAADAALSLRGRGEMYCGWWHSHPASHWCEECPAEVRRGCDKAEASSGDFFSAHDIALHRAVFPRAYSVALVLFDGCRDGGPRWRLFGWRDGVVAPRGFWMLE